MTDAGGGTSSRGAIFSISTTGAVFNTLTDFSPYSGPSSFGTTPYGSLILGGTTLYGMTSQGKGSRESFCGKHWRRPRDELGLVQRRRRGRD